jgi:hypothetical protein
MDSYLFIFITAKTPDKEWGVENGEWETLSKHLIFLLPVPYSPLSVLTVDADYRLM